MKNATPLKLVLEKTYWQDILMVKHHYEAEANLAYSIIGVITIILFYVYRIGIYNSVLAAISSASGLVSYIGKIL